MLAWHYEALGSMLSMDKSILFCVTSSPLFPGEARKCRVFDPGEEGKLTL